MGERGRKSVSELLAPAAVGAVQVVPRPEPPYELEDEAAAVWRATVDALPADWFGAETHPVLTQYCRHVVAAGRLSQLIRQIEGADQLDIKSYDAALKMHEREGRAMSSLATRLRITKQATASEKAKKPPQKFDRPWNS
jgi:hypothetical protein